MVNEHAYPDDGDPQEALSRARELVRRVRATQRVTWFPLLVFAVVIFAAIPVVRYSGFHTVGCKTLPTPQGSGLACTAYSDALLVYWPIALILAYVAVAAFYVHQSRKRGVGTRVRPYVVAGIVLVVVLTGALMWALYDLPITGPHVQNTATVIWQLASPTTAIGIGLLVLAWAERSPALLVFTVGYLVIVLLPINFGWVLRGHWAFTPRLVIVGGVLLLGAVVFALAQRHARLSEA
jgi:hypothetical protein